MRRQPGVRMTVFMLVLLSGPLPLKAYAANDSVRIVTGIARNDDGQIIYRIRFEELWQNGRLTRLKAQYISPNGSLLMSRHAHWRGTELYNPDVVVEHPMTGLKYMVANSGRRVGRRVDETASVEWTQIEPSAPSSNEATTHLLIGKHYKELERGQTIRFSIVAPSRLNWYRFRAKKIGYRTVSGRQAMVVEVQPDAFLIRMFASDLRFMMDTQTHGMIGYEGTVLVRGENGESYDARIEFQESLGVPPGRNKVLVAPSPTY